MRSKIIAGNWKMNKTASETQAYFSEFIKNATKCHFTGKEVIIFPSFLSLHLAVEKAKGISESLFVGSQNMHEASAGAYTGEVSASMIKEAGADFVILGHSERREYFSESNKALTLKIQTALASGLNPILCVGESLEERKSQNHFSTIEKQLQETLKDLDHSQIQAIAIAYEPIWAIGTGETASPEQVQEMHSFIRECLDKLGNQNVASVVPILYGGSVKPDNASALFELQDVDGALVGGASLEVESFVSIINSMA